MSPQSSSPLLARRQEILEGEDRISLSRRVEVHDETHLELKLDYGLPITGRKVSYQVSIYFFFPGSLDLNALTLPRARFYNDLHGYLRFKTPELSLEQLLSTEAEHSPLARLTEQLDEIEDKGRTPRDRLDAAVEECKLYGCLVRVYFRDKLRRLLEMVKLRPEDDRGFYDRERLTSGLLRFHGKAQALLESFRIVRRRARGLGTRVDEALLRALDHVDEYLSSQFEKTFCRLLENVEEIDELLAERVREVLLAGLDLEDEHRERQGYLPGPREDDTNETYAHRMRLLKKFMASALYLDQRRSEPDKVYSDWIGALAAGMAMLFATVAAVQLRVSPMSLDFWMLTLVVLIYILKDRIKELVKRWVSSERLQWFPDLDSTILDPRRGLTLGRCKENTRWLTQDEVPEPIERLRTVHSFTHKDLRRATGETILRYDKKVTLFPTRIHQHHERRGDLNDIIRLTIDRARKHMDEPEMPMRTLDKSGKRVIRVTARKTYPINLVLAYRLDGREPYFEKVRLVLDRQGLQRVETVVPPCSESDVDRLDPGRSVEEWIRSNLL